MSRWSDFLCACNTMTNKREKRYLNIKCVENLRFLLERAGLSSSINMRDLRHIIRKLELE